MSKETKNITFSIGSNRECALMVINPAMMIVTLVLILKTNRHTHSHIYN